MYVPSTSKIISSYDVVSDEMFSTAIKYMSRPYLEAMAMRPTVIYTPCATSSREQTGNIIMFSQFKEEDLSSKTCDDTESGDKLNDGLMMSPLLSKEEMDAMDSGDESDNYLMSTEMLEDIRDGSQSHTNVNSREECYKILDSIKQR